MHETNIYWFGGGQKDLCTGHCSHTMKRTNCAAWRGGQAIKDLSTGQCYKINNGIKYTCNSKFYGQRCELC